MRNGREFETFHALSDELRNHDCKCSGAVTLHRMLMGDGADRVDVCCRKTGNGGVIVRPVRISGKDL